MTEEARALGLKKSVLQNATGLFHPEHQMTARELAILARHIIRTYPEYYATFALNEFQYRKHKFINRNPLLGLVDGVDGLKTGFIKEAGYGIVASAKQDNRRLIAVVNGAKERGRAPGRWAPPAGMGLPEFRRGQAVRRRRGGGPRARMGRQPHVRAADGQGRRQPGAAQFPANQKLKAQIVYKWPLKPPLKKGDQVAMLRVTTSTDATSEVPLYVAEDVEQGGVVRRGLDSILHLATRWMP